jgi:hypothetical protein
LTISYADFKNLSGEQQKKTLEELRNEPGITELLKVWDISRSKLYKMIHELDLSVSTRGKNSKNVSAQKSVNHTASLRGKPKTQIDEDIPVSDANVFSISLNAEGPFKNVSEKLQFLFQQNIVPDTNVRISLSIDEI